MTESYQKTFLRKVKSEQLMRQVNLDLKLVQLGLDLQPEDVLSHTTHLSQNILDMVQLPSEVD